VIVGNYDRLVTIWKHVRYSFSDPIWYSQERTNPETQNPDTHRAMGENTPGKPLIQ